MGAGQAPILVDALRKEEAKVDYTLLDSAGHGGLQFDSADNVKKIVRFLREVAPTQKR